MARKHIILPLHIWNLEGLNVTERLVGSVIYGYSEHGKPCFMTNTGFSKLLHVSRRTASAAVNKLIDLGHVEALEGGSKRTLGWKQLHTRVEATAQEGGSQLLPVIQRLNTDLNTQTNKMNDEIKKNEKTPMHWQQVRDYFLHLMDREGSSHANHAEGWAKDFFTYYEARNWRTKHGAVDKWRPVAAAWYTRSAKNVPQRAVRKVDKEQLRRDYDWHERRYNNYIKRDREEQAAQEIAKMRQIKSILNQHT